MKQKVDLLLESKSSFHLFRHIFTPTPLFFFSKFTTRKFLGNKMVIDQIFTKISQRVTY